MLNKFAILLLVVIFGVVAVAVVLSPVVVMAQCSDCWETPTPTPTPGTPTPYPVPPSATVYATPPEAVTLPGPGSFPVPTSIPAISFPSLPSPIPTPLPLSLTPIPTPNYSSTITYTTALTLSFGGGVTDSAAYTGVSDVIGTGTGWLSDVLTYTGWLSGEVATLQQTGTFTLYNAPAWYAPDLPRPMADVGWTFEQLQADIDAGQRYTLSNWAWFAGYMASLPFQLVKVLFQIVQFLGPLGLFIIWLLLMLPYKLWVKLMIFIKNIFIGLFNFIIQIFEFILKIVGLFI